MSFANHLDAFRARAGGPIPQLEAPRLTEDQNDAFSCSLARFQLGETGEGRIVAQVNRSRLSTVDEDYRECLRLFVAEEGRHARLLGDMVRALGGKTLKRSKGQRTFELARGVFGFRTKLLVLFAAEVVAIAFYGAFASAMPSGDFQQGLQSVVDDERRHLRFHADFFRQHTQTRILAMGVFVAWAVLALGAVALTTCIEIRVLRALGCGTFEPLRRSLAAIKQGFQTLVLRRRSCHQGNSHDKLVRSGGQRPGEISAPVGVPGLAPGGHRQLPGLAHQGVAGH